MELNFFEKFALKFVSTLSLFVVCVCSFNIYFYGKATPGGGFQAGALLASAFIFYEICNNARLISANVINFLSFIGIVIYILLGILPVINTSGGFTLFEFTAFGVNVGTEFGVFLVETGVFVVVFASMVRISRFLCR
jgi:multicomponent Na+:H+ antiporter subunit B